MNMTFVLPEASALGGVVTWSLGMARHLAERNCPTALLGHVGMQERFAPPVCEQVKIVRCAGMLPVSATAEDIAAYLPAYQQVAPATIVPNYTAATYATCAATLIQQPGSLRILGYAHTDTPSYYAWLSYYEPIISAFVAVSEEIAQHLAQWIPHRQEDIVVKPYAVDAAPTLNRRWSDTTATGPIRLLYAGRLQERQKRIFDLVQLAQILAAKKVDFMMQIVGEGSAKPALVAKIKALAGPLRKRICVTDRVPPEKMAALWQSADICVLVSAYEGTSVSMLEAMANGCVPVVTKVSGTASVIEEGVNGYTAAVGDLETMAEQIGELARSRGKVAELGARAHATVVQRYAYPQYVEWFADMSMALWQQNARTWPAHLPVLSVEGAMLNRTIQSQRRQIARLEQRLRRIETLCGLTLIKKFRRSIGMSKAR